jgi:hypothetical protein
MRTARPQAPVCTGPRFFAVRQAPTLSAAATLRAEIRTFSAASSKVCSMLQVPLTMLKIASAPLLRIRKFEPRPEDPKKRHDRRIEPCRCADHSEQYLPRRVCSSIRPSPVIHPVRLLGELSSPTTLATISAQERSRHLEKHPWPRRRREYRLTPILRVRFTPKRKK